MIPVKYTPLPQKLGCIRLLRLLPNNNTTSPLDCELFDANINDEDRVPYEALSYTWGDAGQTVDIRVSGCVFPATVNLEAALRALRKADQPRVLWIDAICINQKDLEEQGEQVRVMWDIYQAADCVVVWLGPADGDTSIAMENFAAKEAQKRLPTRNEWKTEPPAGHEGHWCGCHAGDWASYPPRIGIQKLAERRWFSRVWVLQEVAAAKRITVVCGDHAVDGEDFRTEMIMSAPFNRNFQRILPQIRPALELMNYSRTERKPGLRPLIELVESFRTWDATNPIDKVYALLGLSSDASNVPELRPDYTISSGVLARTLVQFALPNAVISPYSADQERVEFEIDGLLLGKLSSWSMNSETYWTIDTGESDLPDSNFDPAILKLFEETWTFRIASERKLKSGSAVVFLRGSTHPSVLSFNDGKYTVDVLATPEPIKDAMELVIQHSNKAPPEFSGRGWKEALGVLETLSAGAGKLMKFKLSWDPFRQLDSSEAERYIPTPNSVETQFDALLESYKDQAENGSDDYHDCHTVTRYWTIFQLHEDEIKAGTWEHLMTIHKAAIRGYYGTLKLLLDSHADVDARFGDNKTTALHLAAHQGYPKIVKALIDAGAMIDAKGVSDRTPLDYAADKGHAEVCQMLLNAGADPNPSGSTPNPLFMLSVTKAQSDMVKVFLEAGIDASVGIFGGGPTPLHVAAEQGYMEVVKLLLEAGVEASPKLCTGATPLHQAATFGHTGAAIELAAAGADMNAQDIDGMTPLDTALYCGQLETAGIIRIFEGRQNVTTTLEDGEGQRLFDSRNPEIAQFFQECKESIEYGNANKNGAGIHQTSTEEGKVDSSTPTEPKPAVIEVEPSSREKFLEAENTDDQEKAQIDQLLLLMHHASLENRNSVREKLWEYSSMTTLKS